MSRIIPAVMPRNYEDLEEKVRIVKDSVDSVQIDIMDGVFVSGKTWPFVGDPKKHYEEIQAEREGVPHWEDVEYELDLMIDQPEKTILEWLMLGPARVVIHIESVQDWGPIYDAIDRSYEITKWGISFNTDYPREEIEKRMEKFHYIQCMGIDEIGAQGQPFSDRVLDNVQYFREKYPEMLITVDGSVNVATIGDLADVGVDQFIAGSAVYHTDSPPQAIEELEDLI